MSRSIRPRPIDFSKPMPVVQSQRELELNEDGVLIPKKDVQDPLVDQDDENDEDMETIRILNEQYEKDQKKANIPVPPIIILEDYDKFVAKDYQRPQSYLRYKQPTEKELDENVEYEMDDADLTWVNQTLPLQKLSLKEEKFEQIVDRLEKESYKLGKMCEVSVLETFKMGGKVAVQVYEWWRKKREKLGKPLVRRFQPATSVVDNSPHSTFRPREKEEKRIRRTRKNDKDAHKKLKNLQADLRRAKELLEQVVRREKMKKVLLELDFCLQFAKDIKDIPTHMLLAHEAFFKELRDKQRTNKTGGPEVVGQENQGVPRQRPAPRPAVVPGAGGVEEEAVIKIEEQAPEKLEGIQRCFQHLMRTWDEDGDDTATSVLPITNDLKMVVCGTPSAEASLRFRGRARIGRGGRVVFDRCSHRVAGLHMGEGEDGPGSKRSYYRRSGGEAVGTVWEELRQVSKGDADEPPLKKVCWDFGAVHSKIPSAPKRIVVVPGGAQPKPAPPNPGIGGNMKMQSLGGLSAFCGQVAMKKRGLLEVGMLGLNGGKPLKKEKHVEEHDAAASTASTAMGAD